MCNRLEVAERVAKFANAQYSKSFDQQDYNPRNINQKMPLSYQVRRSPQATTASNADRRDEYLCRLISRTVCSSRLRSGHSHITYRQCGCQSPWDTCGYGLLDHYRIHDLFPRVRDQWRQSSRSCCRCRCLSPRIHCQERHSRIEHQYLQPESLPQTILFLCLWLHLCAGRAPSSVFCFIFLLFPT